MEVAQQPRGPVRRERARSPFSRELWIERDDFMEEPPRKFFRLAPGREVRLRSAYFMTCTEVVKDDAGEDRGAALHVRPGDARRRRARRPPAEGHAALGVGGPRRAGRGPAVRPPLPRPGSRRRRRDLFEDLNPDSETVLRGCLVEPSLADAAVGETVQFERLGYFCPDPDSAPGRAGVQPHAHAPGHLGEAAGAGAAEQGLTAISAPPHAAGRSACQPVRRLRRVLSRGTLCLPSGAAGEWPNWQGT